MATTKFTKQPGEILDYDVDFRPWLIGRTDTPASYAVVVETGLTLVASSRNGSVVKLILSGGVSGTKYKVTVSLTTAAGLVKEADFLVAVKEV